MAFLEDYYYYNWMRPVEEPGRFYACDVAHMIPIKPRASRILVFIIKYILLISDLGPQTLK